MTGFILYCRQVTSLPPLAEDRNYRVNRYSAVTSYLSSLSVLFCVVVHLWRIHCCPSDIMCCSCASFQGVILADYETPFRIHDGGRPRPTLLLYDVHVKQSTIGLRLPSQPHFAFMWLRYWCCSNQKRHLSYCCNCFNHVETQRSRAAT